MKKSIASRSQQPRRPKADVGRPTIGIRELKAKASAIIDDVKSRRVCYAVTKRGTVEALIVPVDAGERLLGQADVDSGWDAWQTLVEQLTKEVDLSKHGDFAADQDQNQSAIRQVFRKIPG